MRSSSVLRAAGRVAGRELRVRVAQQQLGIVGEHACQTILIDSHRFGRAPEPHQLVGVLLARGCTLPLTFTSFSSLRSSPSGSSV